ncbi:MAG TPA: hypothetical protein PLP42_08185 [Acidobacteriota bacterium]|nr:hypothetical protein [Acidobacteriota bacterium]
MVEPLVEFKPVFLPDTPEFRALAGEIHRRFGQQIEVSWATPFSPRIQLCNLGFAGGIAVGDTQVRLHTKVPVAQLFRLLEYVYDLFRVEEGLIPTQETEQIFESLADIWLAIGNSSAASPRFFLPKRQD